MTDAKDIADEYNLRAGIEPLIGDLKHGMGIGKIPSQSFNANHAMLLLKLLAFNLLRGYVEAHFAPLARWNTPWLRRALISLPGRFVRSGRQRRLRVHPRCLLAQYLN